MKAMRRRITLQLRKLSRVKALRAKSTQMLFRFAEALGVHPSSRRFWSSIRIYLSPYLILLRFKLGESFFSPDNIGFLSAAELKEFLLAPYVCFCGFEVGALTFRRRDLRSFS